jgi:hypothetical protein
MVFDSVEILNHSLLGNGQDGENTNTAQSSPPGMLEPCTPARSPSLTPLCHLSSPASAAGS